MSQEQLCSCLREQSGASEPGECELTLLATPNFATLRTPEQNVHAIARKGEGWYELALLHRAGMEAFAVRSARMRPAPAGQVLRVVTWSQIGSEEWMHTANDVVLCSITSPRSPATGCVRHPLYAHTRLHAFDLPTEKESRFRVAVTSSGVRVEPRSQLQHPELLAALGDHGLGQR